MSDGDQRQPRGGPARRRSPWTVLAVGTCWCAVAIICSAALVPPDDEGSVYLIDHGRIEHYPSRLASVTPLIANARARQVVTLLGGLRVGGTVPQ